MRALVSLIVAVVASVVGEALLWGGGASAMRIAQSSGGLDAAAVVPVILAIVGILFVAIAMLTAAWSSLGVVVMGVIHVVVGGAALVLSPAVEVAILRPLRAASPDIAGGIDYAAATGMLLVTGVVLLVGGIALAARKARSSAAGRVTSLVLAVVLGVGLLPLLAIGGFRIVEAALVRLSAVVEVVGAGLVLGAVVLLVVVVAMVRWSSLGAFVIGAAVAAAGFFALVAPGAALHPLAFAPELVGGATYVALTGQLALLGMLLVTTAIAGLIRAARRRALERGAGPGADVEESIGYQQEGPTQDLGGIFPPSNPV